jgi:hypothetical protein
VRLSARTEISRTGFAGGHLVVYQAMTGDTEFYAIGRTYSPDGPVRAVAVSCQHRDPNPYVLFARGSSVGVFGTKRNIQRENMIQGDTPSTISFEHIKMKFWRNSTRAARGDLQEGCKVTTAATIFTVE